MVDSAHQHGGSEDYDTCFVGGCDTPSDAKGQKGVSGRDDQLDAGSFAGAPSGEIGMSTSVISQQTK